MQNTKIIDGKKISAALQVDLKKEINSLERKPTLAVILIGDNPASLIYVGHKKKISEKIGIQTDVYHLSPVMTQDALISFIEELNQNKTVDGILIQLPLPAPFEEAVILETVSPEKDVDGLHRVNLGKLFVGEPALLPCTPLACMALIKSVCKTLSGKNAVVIGRSRLVGKPLAQMLLEEQCTVTQAHSKTKNLARICKTADILISATGHPNLIKKSFVKKGAILIDVGITRLSDNKIVGDIAFNEMIGYVKAITPVPGGVGPMTVTMLFSNVVKACKKNLQKARNDVELK